MIAVTDEEAPPTRTLRLLRSFPHLAESLPVRAVEAVLEGLETLREHLPPRLPEQRSQVEQLLPDLRREPDYQAYTLLARVCRSSRRSDGSRPSLSPLVHGRIIFSARSVSPEGHLDRLLERAQRRLTNRTSRGRH